MAFLAVLSIIDLHNNRKYVNNSHSWILYLEYHISPGLCIDYRRDHNSIQKEKILESVSHAAVYEDANPERVFADQEDNI